MRSRHDWISWLKITHDKMLLYDSFAHIVQAKLDIASAGDNGDTPPSVVQYAASVLPQPPDYFLGGKCGRIMPSNDIEET